MATEVITRFDEDEGVRDLLRSLCDGVLTFSLVDPKLREVLSHVRKPSSLNRVLYLPRRRPTYKHRLQLTRTFLTDISEQKKKITEPESFRRELENYIADKQGLCLDQNLLEKLEGEQISRKVPGNVNWLEEGRNDEIHGVVLRRSPNYLSLLVVSADPNTLNQRSDEETEIVIPGPSQLDFPGFGVGLKIGDMISVRLANDVKERKVVNISLKG